MYFDTRQWVARISAVVILSFFLFEINKILEYLFIREGFKIVWSFPHFFFCIEPFSYFQIFIFQCCPLDSSLHSVIKRWCTIVPEQRAEHSRAVICHSHQERPTLNALDLNNFNILNANFLNFTFEEIKKFRFTY